MKLDYQQRITLGAQFFGANMPAGVFNVTVAHDRACKAHRGKACTCVPDIDVSLGSRKFSIDEEGVMHEKTNAR